MDFQEKGVDIDMDGSGKWNGEYEKLRAPTYAFVLPNLLELPTDFRNFLEKDLIETSTLKRLENSGKTFIDGFYFYRWMLLEIVDCKKK